MAALKSHGGALAGRGAACSPSRPSYGGSSPPTTTSYSRSPIDAPPRFPGSSHGRLSQPAIRRALAQLDAPASLWEDPPGTPIGEGANGDRRALLHNLTAWNLWLERREQRTAAATG